MISKKELKLKTGFTSFLQFRRHCQKTSTIDASIGQTKYYYNKNKTVELNMKPEELFIAIQDEILKKHNPAKASRKKNQSSSKES
jgi:hypothetical protein